MFAQLTCRQCEITFPASKKDVKRGRLYCSKTCVTAYESTHGRPKKNFVPHTFSCEACEKPFNVTPGDLRTYHQRFGKDPSHCSRECYNTKRIGTSTRDCTVCGKSFTTTGYSLARTETCSDPCRRTLQRQNLLARNELVRPSDTREIQRSITKQGYVRLRFPNQNGIKGREILEHRLVMERHLGRALRPEETVHHRVKPTTNNSLDNLELFSNRHGPGQRVSEQIEWATKLLLDYPDLAREAGFSHADLPPNVS